MVERWAVPWGWWSELWVFCERSLVSVSESFFFFVFERDTVSPKVIHAWVWGM